MFGGWGIRNSMNGKSEETEGLVRFLRFEDDVLRMGSVFSETFEHSFEYYLC